MKNKLIFVFVLFIGISSNSYSQQSPDPADCNALAGIDDLEKERCERRKELKNKLANKSPEDKLKDKYTSIMAVNDCYELRKSYVVKYIDDSVYQNARNAMKIFESTILKEVPKINTNKLWEDAAKEYKSSLVGIALEVNKTMPDKLMKDNKSYCTLMAIDLINTLPKTGPKKDF